MEPCSCCCILVFVLLAFLLMLTALGNLTTATNLANRRRANHKGLK